MTYEAKFKEKGHAWHTYRRLTNMYRAMGDSNAAAATKISGSTIVICDNAVSNLEKFANKIQAKFSLEKLTA